MPPQGTLDRRVRGPAVPASCSAAMVGVAQGGGNFQINFEAKTTEQTTTLNTQGLLMEGLRMLDESKRESGVAAGEEEDVLLDT